MGDLSHLDAHGRARMVDVGAKAPSRRRAWAEARVELGKEAFSAVLDGTVAKGDALAVARVAGIQAAKRTSETIPLCHPLPLDYVRVEFEALADAATIRVVCEAATTAATGVEMEAMTGAAAAALTLYDMCKSLRKRIRIEGLRLLRKEGGRSGTWRADGDEGADR